MTGIFNFPYLQLNEILRASEQKYTLNTNYEYQQVATDMLIYVKSGQILLYADTSYVINPHELLIISTDKPVTLIAAVPDTIALHIIFKATSDHLTALRQHIFMLDDTTLITKISADSQKITFLRRRKPEMSYDVEIGEFFTVACALLYADVTQLLLTLSAMEIRTRLPQTITKPNASMPTPNWSTMQNQLVHAKTVSGTLYKNLLVNQVIAYMKANLDKKMTITLIAQEFLVGNSNLKKIFKYETGVSIMAYFRKLKMATAKTLVQQHQISYTELADELGFSSSHHFSTAFKKYVGVSPTQYYKSLQQDN